MMLATHSVSGTPDVSELRVILKNLCEKYPDTPFNRGMAFAFYSMLGDAHRNLMQDLKMQSKPLGYREIFAEIANRVELSSWFFEGENLPALEIAIRMTFQKICDGQHKYVREQEDHVGMIQGALNEFSRWHTGACDNYASVAIYELLQHESLRRRPLHFMWLHGGVSEEGVSEVKGHAVILIDEEFSVRSFRGRIETLPPEVIVFDFWEGVVCPVKEYDFSSFKYLLSVYSPSAGVNPFTLTENFPERLDRCFGVNNQVSTQLRTVFLNILFNRFSSGGRCVPGDFERFIGQAARDVGHFDPSDVTDQRRIQRMLNIAEVGVKKAAVAEENSVAVAVIEPTNQPKAGGSKKKSGNDLAFSGFKGGFLTSKTSKKDEKKSSQVDSQVGAEPKGKMGGPS